jgi:hypothetical protein
MAAEEEKDDLQRSPRRNAEGMDRRRSVERRRAAPIY